MVYEEDMREKSRVLAEEKSIAEAERSAKNEAKKFLASDEGVLTVREEAIKRMRSPKTNIVHKFMKRLPVLSTIT